MKLKMTHEQKQKFVGVLADLLENGFSFKECFHFMSRASLFSQQILSMFQKRLVAGYPISQSFEKCGYTSQQVTQIRLAEIHGNLSATLKKMEEQMILVHNQKKNLQKAITYPSLLLVFLLGILVAMRQIILPQLLAGGLIDTSHLGISFLMKFPVFLVFFLLTIMVTMISLKLFFRRKSQLEKSLVLGKLPLIKTLYCSYISGYFALEWGKLFQEGLELKEIIFCMKKPIRKAL